MTAPHGADRPVAHYDRRAFLQRAGLAGAAGALGGAGLLGAVRPAAAADDALVPFLHGVASGDPTASSVVLWTRVDPAGGGGPVTVTWEISSDAGFATIVGSGTVEASPEHDWTVKVVAEGLAPFAYHWYRFRADGVTSIVGRTKTAPAAGQVVDRLRLGLVSCSNYEGGYFNAYARLAERNDLDAILCAGDYLYEYGQGAYGPGADIGRVVEPPLEPGVTQTQTEAEERRLISPTQQAFVEGALSGSDASWRLVLQQVMLMQWRIPALPEGLAGAPDFPSPATTSTRSSSSAARRPRPRRP